MAGLSQPRSGNVLRASEVSPCYRFLNLGPDSGFFFCGFLASSSYQYLHPLVFPIGNAGCSRGVERMVLGEREANPNLMVPGCYHLKVMLVATMGNHIVPEGVTSRRPLEETG